VDYDAAHLRRLAPPVTQCTSGERGAAQALTSTKSRRFVLVFPTGERAVVEFREE
jgi:hypothetical protein